MPKGPQKIATEKNIPTSYFRSVRKLRRNAPTLLGQHRLQLLPRVSHQHRGAVRTLPPKGRFFVPPPVEENESAIAVGRRGKILDAQRVKDRRVRPSVRRDVSYVGVAERQAEFLVQPVTVTGRPDQFLLRAVSGQQVGKLHRYAGLVFTDQMPQPVPRCGVSGGKVLLGNSRAVSAEAHFRRVTHHLLEFAEILIVGFRHFGLVVGKSNVKMGLWNYIRHPLSPRLQGDISFVSFPIHL
jgi:hypothetical protein